jgi:hypothetical protein
VGLRYPALSIAPRVDTQSLGSVLTFSVSYPCLGIDDAGCCGTHLSVLLFHTEEMERESTEERSKVAGAMIPVGIRYVFALEAADVGDEELTVVLTGRVDYTILAHGPLVSPLAKNKQVKSLSPGR